MPVNLCKNGVSAAVAAALYSPAVTWIRSPAELERLVQALASCRAIGLDTESDSLYHHRDKVCLVQIATDRGEAFLVDSLAVDLRPLGPAMADPQLVKVLHGADYDVTTLKRDFGFGFAALFDTMIAARLLGRSELGLVAVARDELGATLTKTNQKDDWSRRPHAAAGGLRARRRPASRRAARAARGEASGGGRLDWLREESRRRRPARAARSPPRSRRLPGRQGRPAAAPALARGAARALRLARAAGGGDGHPGLQDPRQREPAQARGAPAGERGRPARRARRAATALPPCRGHPGRSEASAGARRAGAAGGAACRAPGRSRRAAPARGAPQGVADAQGRRAGARRSRGAPAAPHRPPRGSCPGDVSALGRVEGLRAWRASAFGAELLAAVS